MGGSRAAYTTDVPGTLPEVTSQPPATRMLTCMKSATSEAGAVTSSILQREMLSCQSEQQAQARRAERPARSQPPPLPGDVTECRQEPRVSQQPSVPGVLGQNHISMTP